MKFDKNFFVYLWITIFIIFLLYFLVVPQTGRYKQLESPHKSAVWYLDTATGNIYIVYNGEISVRYRP